MKRRLTLAGKVGDPAPIPVYLPDMTAPLTIPRFDECLRPECDYPILVGQKVVSLSSDGRVYHAHLNCPDHE